MKKCEGCIWFDMCGCDDVCGDYTPIDDTEIEEVVLADYRDDLRSRHEEYIELIEEQND